MKRKLPRWAVYLIGIGISLFLSALGSLFMGTRFEDLGITLSVILGFIALILLLALLIHGLRGIVHRATKDHPSVEEELAQRGTPSARSKKEVFRANPSAQDATWPVVITLLVTLFPMGIYLLILKTSYEKTRYFSNGVRLMVLGAVMMVPTLGFILLVLHSGATRARDLWMLTGIAGVPFLVGLFCFVFGWVLRHRGLENDAYRRLILVDRVTDMETITQRMRTDYAHATRVIERLMDSELLPDAYLYHRDHELIVPGISKKIALRCKHCSGTTVLYSNEDRICAYCGGAL